ncbi:MAG: glycoside hydrolase family 9 protein [Kiritimatiellae bacterium]|nr:glycoside hydrolase family 9 protein [Kiritimatiellia bacterium]
MNFGQAMATAAVVVRFLDPHTSVVQTDDASVGAEWAREAGYWAVPMGLKDPVAEEQEARVVHACFRVHGAVPAEYDPEAPSPLFKVNQVGYLPWAPKYGYIGAWLGPELGAWKPKDALGGWQLVDAETGEVVKESAEPPVFRVKDGTTVEGVSFTGEETYEMDFSDVEREGTYFLRIPGVGRSRDFRIWKGAAEEAFRVHMGGLYQKRCGIAKEEPWTHWTAGACHVDAVRGTFASDEGKLEPETSWFDIIRYNTDWKGGEKLKLPGGWHDAADYDRRPMHLYIVNDLCAVWQMRPGNFSDGQLAIPESANGIPDILDEAEWGLRHLLAGQQADGGVGTWVETTGHPGPGNVAERDPMRYALARATRKSSLMYAAHAAQLARCGDWFREKYLESAVRAWNFATRTKPRSEAFQVKKKKWRVFTWDEDVFWDEDRELPPEFLVKAALNLYALTGERRYAEALKNEMPRAMEAFAKNGWNWRPLTFAGELAAGGAPEEADEFLRKWEKKIANGAEELLQQLETSYAYRTPWWAPRKGWFHTLGLGHGHPLVRAQWFVAAHGLTGDGKYLRAASLANDFHNGCNPSGTTLTSGLGEVYPVAFLDLPSYADGIAEYVPGITPYRWTYTIPQKAKEMLYGGDGKKASKWPIWRRFANLESLTVGASEYTVWETIAPAASVTGYLTEPSGTRPGPRRAPAKSLRELEGYWVLP